MHKYGTSDEHEKMCAVYLNVFNHLKLRYLTQIESWNVSTCLIMEMVEFVP